MTASRREHDWFSHALPDNVRLGERAWIYSSYAFRHYSSRRPIGVRVGSDTGIYHGSFFELGPHAEVEIGDYCSLVGVIIATNGRVTIGDYTFIAHEVVIAETPWATPSTNVTGSKHPPARPVAAAFVDIGRNAWIGAQATLLGSIRIGEGAIIGAGTLVTRDVPPFTVCAGNPMQIVRTISPKERSSLD